MELEGRSRPQVWSRLAILIGIVCVLSDFALARPQAPTNPDASECFIRNTKAGPAFRGRS
jgi:hypothetical protein